MNEELDTLSEGKRIARVSVWFAICNIVQKLSMLVSVPIFTRLMVAEEYGLVAVHQSWNNILVIIVTLSLYMGVFNNGMLKYETDRDRYIAGMQGLSTVSAIVFLSIYLCLKNQISGFIGLPLSTVTLMFVYYIFHPSFEYWSARNRYEYKYKGLLAATIIYSILNIVVPVVAVLHGKGNLGIVKINASIITLIAFTLFFYCLNWVKGKTFYVEDYWKYAFWFNLPLIPNYLAAILLAQVDRIMINHYCGSTYAGIYSVACYLQTGVSIIITSINSSYVPWLYEKLKNNDIEPVQKRSETILWILGVITFFIISASPEIIRILASKEYFEAAVAAPPVVFGTFVTGLYMMYANVEIYYEKRIFMTCATSAAAMLNFALNYLMIPYFGYIACAYTTIISYIVYAIAHYFFMEKIRTGENKTVGDIKIYKLRRHIGIYVIVGIFSSIQYCLFDYIVVRYILLAIVALFVLYVWRKNYAY